MGLLVSGQPMAVFFASRSEWLSHRKGLFVWRPSRPGPRGRSKAGSGCGGKALLRAEFTGPEWPVGHGDTGRQSRKWAGTEAGSYFGIALPVKYDAASDLARRQLAGAAPHQWTNHGHLGAADGRWTHAPDYRLWQPTHVHHAKSFLVVGRTFNLRRSGKRGGRHCAVKQSQAVGGLQLPGACSSSFTRL